MENKPAKQQAAILPMISAGASSRDLVKAFANITPAKVLGGNFPSMAKIRKDIGEEKAEKALAILVADTAMAFGEDLTEDQALYFANEILNAFFHLSLEDCFIVLNRMKRAKMYKFNLNAFLTAFENYNTERVNMADDLSYSQHLSVKEERPINVVVQAANKIKKVKLY